MSARGRGPLAVIPGELRSGEGRGARWLNWGGVGDLFERCRIVRSLHLGSLPSLRSPGMTVVVVRRGWVIWVM